MRNNIVLGIQIVAKMLLLNITPAYFT